MILCIGTTPTVQRTQFFARLQIDSVNRARTTLESASGKSINVARVVHTLGEKVIAGGIVGGDSGEFIRQDLTAAGIAHDFITTAAKTRTCTTVLDETSGTHTELVEESQPAGADAWTALEKKIAELMSGSRLMVLSGTLAPDGPDDFYARCARVAGAAGIRVIIDGRGKPLELALAERPFVVKPNRAEVAATFGIDPHNHQAVIAAMLELINRGTNWVIVTAGREPTWITNGEHFWQLRTPTVKAVNPIGSGDSFAGGLAAGLHRGMDVPEAAILAAAAAAANAMTAMPGHLRLEDVRTLTGKIALEPLDPSGLARDK